MLNIFPIHLIALAFLLGSTAYGQERLFFPDNVDAHRALYEAAKHWHGCWTAALEAAGFPRPPCDYYTPDEVRLRIIDLYERALPLTFQSHNDVKLQSSCKKHLGGWRQAVESLDLGSEL